MRRDSTNRDWKVWKARMDAAVKTCTEYDPPWRADAIRMAFHHADTGLDQGYSRDETWENLADTMKETGKLEWYIVVEYFFDVAWPVKRERKRNPITVTKKGKKTDRGFAGIPLGEKTYYIIEAVNDAGEKVLTLHLYHYDDVDGEYASIELVEAPKLLRNVGHFLLPVMRKAFALAKDLGVLALQTEACHRKIYNFAVKFKTPDIVRPNANMGSNIPGYSKGGIFVPIEKLPDPNIFLKQNAPSLSDAREIAATIKDGYSKPERGYAPDEYFEASGRVYRWDEHMTAHKILGVAVDYNERDRNMFYSVIKETQPEDLGKYLPDTSPLDIDDVDAAKLPMLKIIWLL